MIQLKEEDVVFTWGAGLRATQGNRRYWEMILSLREHYKMLSPGDHYGKTHVERQILDSVAKNGGRFLRCDSHHQQEVFRELPQNAALNKIRSSLRDTYVPEFSSSSSTSGTKPLSTVKPDITADSGRHEQIPLVATSTSTSSAVGMPSVSTTLDRNREPSLSTPHPFASVSDAGISLNPNKDDNPNLSRREKPLVPGQPKNIAPEFNAEGKLELRDEDVLAGQGSGPNNHPGNVSYLVEVRRHQQKYQALKLKERKKRSDIAYDIFNWVTKRNGRFLRRDSDGEYQELSISEALVKIKDALRDKKYRVSQEDDVEMGKSELPTKAVSPSPPINRDRYYTGNELQHSDKFKAVERNEQGNIIAQYGSDVAMQDAEDSILRKRNTQPDEMALSKLSISSVERTAKRPASENAKLATNDLLSVAQAITLLRDASKKGAGNADLYEGELDLGKHSKHEGVRIILDSTDDAANKRMRLSYGNSTGTQKELVLTEVDVLGGRGGGSNNHPGNEKYWEKICELRRAYQDVNPRDHTRKCQIANQVFEFVHAKGGRFLERDTKTRVIYELPEKRALEKIKQALRDKYVPFSLREHG